MRSNLSRTLRRRGRGVSEFMRAREVASSNITIHKTRKFDSKNSEIDRAMGRAMVMVGELFP
jgi:hypothetical protein